MTLDGRRVLVGFSGGIACYKACVRQSSGKPGVDRPGGDDAAHASS